MFAFGGINLRKNTETAGSLIKKLNHNQLSTILIQKPDALIQRKASDRSLCSIIPWTAEQSIIR